MSGRIHISQAEIADRLLTLAAIPTHTEAGEPVASRVLELDANGEKLTDHLIVTPCYGVEFAEEIR